MRRLTGGVGNALLGVLVAALVGCTGTPSGTDGGDARSDTSTADSAPDAMQDSAADMVTAEASAEAGDAASDSQDAQPDSAADVVDASPCGADPRLGTACTPSNACEVGAFTCVGATVTCTGTGRPQPSTMECRASAGACDVAERCDGTALACPTDGFAPSTMECRASTGACDAPETCTGSSGACPADALRAAGFTCRASAGECDVAETCNGTSNACPTDGFRSVGTACAAGFCDATGACNSTCTPGMACSTGNACERGTVDCSGATPRCVAAGPAAAGTVCRASAGVCDVAETCNGTSTACPADALAPSTTVCRASAGGCDVAENCNGTSPACPADAFAPSSTMCRASAGACDVAETCSGTAAACPADAFAPSTAVCRASAGVCDVAETCSGTAAACPADAFLPSTTACRASSGVCDVAETCTGTTAACPADAFAPSTTVCRASSGVCDVAENCSGAAAACPADAFLPSTTVCRAASGACDAAERCTGSAAACPADALAPSGTVCRAAAGACDVVETCSGSSNACPADALASAGTVCRPSANIPACDPAESCSGSSAACPADVVTRAPTTEACDGMDNDCDGVVDGAAANASCPAGAPVCYRASCARPVPPRPLAPLSTATVTSRRPLLRWTALHVQSDSVQVDLCRDRACTSVIASLNTTATSLTPTADLPVGVVFWRLRAVWQGFTGTADFGTWQFNVGARTAPLNVSSGTVLDLNGDGYADLAVGDASFNSSVGRVNVYYGGPSGLPSAPSVSLDPPGGAGSILRFGASVASAGDVNGDGFCDLVVGAPGSSASGGNNGAVYWYLGNAGGVVGSPGGRLLGQFAPRAGSFIPDVFGWSVSSAGDVNGDGYADVLMGAPGWNDREGYVQLHYGSAAGVQAATAYAFRNGAEPTGQLGFSVASAGDLNADGFGDIVVGSPGAFSGGGFAQAWSGSATGLGAMSPVTYRVGTQAGYSVAGVGDLDGDGRSDFAVGAPQTDTGSGAPSGVVGVYLGTPSGAATQVAVLEDRAYPGANFGYSVAGGNDVNGDGFADLLVGSPFARSNAGLVYLYTGSAGGPATTPTSTLPSPNSQFGSVVAGLGDVDRDGFADIAAVYLNGSPVAGWFRGSAAGLSGSPISTWTANGQSPLASAWDVLLPRRGRTYRFLLS